MFSLASSRVFSSDIFFEVVFPLLEIRRACLLALRLTCFFLFFFRKQEGMPRKSPFLLSFLNSSPLIYPEPAIRNARGEAQLLAYRFLIGGRYPIVRLIHPGVPHSFLLRLERELLRCTLFPLSSDSSGIEFVSLFLCS